MGNATEHEWTAALAAWEHLDENQRVYALGWLASGHPQLLHQAAAEAGAITREAMVTAVATVGAANTAVAHLDTRGMRDVLSFLAMYQPDAVLLAVRETGA